MTINLRSPDIRELRPRITVFGVGGAGGNAVNNMIESGLAGVDFVVANTDAQALAQSKAERIVQMGVQVTEGLGAGSQPEVGRAAAEEVMDEIRDHLLGAHMVFITAGMGGGTGTGAAPVVAQAARESGILTVGVVTKPFHFEGQRRMRTAEAGIEELQKHVDTLIVIPNQNLFRVANERTTFADAFAMADEVLFSGVACITDLMVKEGLINLDFADVRAVMREMGKAMMGTGEASGEKRAIEAAEAAIANPLLDDVSMKGARGVLISITGGNDLTLYEVDEAATRIREEVDPDANIILGATFDQSLDGVVRVSVVATGIDQMEMVGTSPAEQRIAELTQRLRDRAPRQAEPAPRAVQQHAPQPVAETHAYAPQPVAPVYAQAAQAPVAAYAAAPAYSAPEPHRGLEAVAAAVAVNDDITIRAVPKQQVYAEPLEPEPDLSYEPAPAQPYIPPMPERPVARNPRMPRIDELPVPAQNQIRASRREDVADLAAAERKRMTLLQRLASVGGLGRKEDDGLQDHGHAAPQRAVQSEFAKRPAAVARPQAGFDAHGRSAGPLAPRASDDDQLEIPAFLRRQAN
jgi:cell division protein FtsZ